MNGVLLAAMLEVGVVSWRDVTKGRTVVGLPPAGDYLAVIVIFGSLMAIGTAPTAHTFANVFAWGILAATATGLADPSTLGTAKVSKGEAKATSSASAVGIF